MEILFDKLKRTFLYSLYLTICKFFTGINKFIVKKYKKYNGKLFRYYTLKYKYPKEYKKYSKQPVDESKVLFVEIRLDVITNSFSLLFDELVKNYDLNIHTHFLRTSFIKKIDVHRRNLALIRDMATAKYIFTNEASQVISCVNLRAETKVINTWHGCGAFKKFGFSTADLIFGANQKDALKYPFYKNLSTVTVSSPEVAWAYNEAMNQKPEENVVKALGVSRTDFFYNQDYIDKAYETLYDLFPQAKDKKVILFAPTFRGRVANPTTSTMFNLDMFQKELGDEYVVICKHHPLVKKIAPIPEHLKDFAVDFTKTMNIEDLICVSDICISDYSSLVFEYSLFERPLIFFAYDLDTYFDWRGFYYDYFELAPGPICTKNREMIDYIKNIDTQFDKEKIKAFRQKFMSSCDGHSTQRIIKEIFGDNLAKYKREIPLTGSYSDIPKANPGYHKIMAKLENLKLIKELANKIYNITNIQNDKIVIVYKSLNGMLSAEFIEKYISQNTKFDVSLIKETLNVDSCKKIIKSLASAKVIILVNTSQLVDVLPNKQEQKIVFVRNETFPIYKFGYQIPTHIDSLKKDFLEISTPYKNITDVAISSKEFENLYMDSLKHEKTTAVGSVLADLICDENFKNESLQILHEIMPTSVDKKIILYIPSKRTEDKKRVLLEQNVLKEELEENYVVLFHYGIKDSGAIVSPSIYQNFMKSIYGSELSLLRALSIADILIGDVRPETMLYTVKNKPIFLYEPFGVSFKDEQKLNFDLNELKYGVNINDSYDLVEKIKDIQNYDYTNVNAFKQKYYGLSDSNTVERIVKNLLPPL